HKCSPASDETGSCDRLPAQMLLEEKLAQGEIQIHRRQINKCVWATVRKEMDVSVCRVGNVGPSVSTAYRPRPGVFPLWRWDARHWGVLTTVPRDSCPITAQNEPEERARLGWAHQGWCGTPRGSHGANDDVNSALKPPLGGSGFSGHAPEEVPLIAERQTSSTVMYEHRGEGREPKASKHPVQITVIFQSERCRGDEMKCCHNVAVELIACTFSGHHLHGNTRSCDRRGFLKAHWDIFWKEGADVFPAPLSSLSSSSRLFCVR
ncbi:putative aminoacrylate hydrolase RutD, partial [Dissostichus eleginoides]